ncbi:hypothetical protein [Micromonospora sp. CPCC 205561]|uniref:hypothetical protein n=1 Tax=Micromonospora sp. CPCC 205561 TaxID=3122407 RepID=UPI002FEF54B7
MRPADDGGAVLRHTLIMATGWPAWLTWPLFFRPLHDALIEDSLDRAAASLGVPVATPFRWSRRVRMLRRLAALGAEVRRARGAGAAPGHRVGREPQH